MKEFFNKRFITFLAITLVIALVSTAIAADGTKWIGAFYVSGKVGLKWQKAADATEYIIYRSVADGEFEELTRVKKPQYFDVLPIAGTVLSYKIGYIGADGAEVLSSVKKVTTPAAAAGEFKAPVWSGIRIDRKKILLRWDKVPGAIAYNVYRSVTSGDGYEVIGNATANRHSDGDGLEKGTTYYYVISGLNDQFEETELSEERSLKFGTSKAELDSLEKANEIVLIDIPMSLVWKIESAGNDGDLNQPADLAINSAGDVYITDVNNNRVCVFDKDGKYKFSFGTKTPPDLLDNPPTGSFSSPFTVEIDKADKVYVSDIINGDIQVFEPDGTYSKTINVTVEEGMQKFKPNTFVILENGNLICVDGGNHRLVWIDQNGAILKTVGKRGAGDGEFNYPDGITLAPDGTIFVVDGIGARVVRFTKDGEFMSNFGKPGVGAGEFGRPKAIIADDKEQLWVSDAMGHLVQVLAYDGTPKSVVKKFDKDGEELVSPRGMVLRDGRFYIVNRINHTLLVMQLD